MYAQNAASGILVTFTVQKNHNGTPNLKCLDLGLCAAISRAHTFLSVSSFCPSLVIYLVMGRHTIPLVKVDNRQFVSCVNHDGIKELCIIVNIVSILTY